MELKNKEGAEKQAWEQELRKKYAFHPLAGMFPMMEGEELDGLANDIRANGQNRPILHRENQIFDGRNRFEACIKMGVEPVFKEWVIAEDQIRTFILSENFQRRHLTVDQKAEVAVILRKDKLTQVAIAKILNVSEGTVNRWLKLNSTIEDTETRIDSMGRERPTKYNKPVKQEKEETPEEREARLMAEAAEDLEEWFESFEELSPDCLKKIFARVAKNAKNALEAPSTVAN